jgi:AcrR family transcriptional regulator
MEKAERSAGRRRDAGTDAALIEAVLDLISAGATLSGLSLVEIAKHAGVSRNSLYRRWKTKDALYLDVLDSINRPQPDLSKPTASENLADLLAVLVERTIDKRASRMLRALNAEAEAFPEVHRRYFAEIVAPRRQAMYQAIRRGVEAGEIRPDVDEALLTDVLVGPILSRMSSGATDDLDPLATSRRITELVLEGARPK